MESYASALKRKYDLLMTNPPGSDTNTFCRMSTTGGDGNISRDI